MQRDSFKDLSEWKTSLLRLNENKFLDIVRMYVGLIKTPYNKEKLLNDLVSFLYKAENRETLVKILSENDYLLLNAIHFLDKPSIKNLLAFFGDLFSTYYITDFVLNLEERLIVYKVIDPHTKKEYLEINPLWEDVLAPFFDISILVPLGKIAQIHESEKNPPLSAFLFVSWYAFLCQYPDACRADGTFKKKTLATLENLFYGVSVDFLLLLNTAFVNLGLFFHDGALLYPHEQKWKAFSALSSSSQVYHICVASFSRFPRDTLIKYVGFVQDLVDNLGENLVTKTSLHRLMYLLKSTQKDSGLGKKSGFFAKVLQNAQNPIAEEEIFTDNLLIEKLVYFGVLDVVGEDQLGNDLFSARQKHQKSTGFLPFISINAGFSVTFLANTDLQQMLLLVKCMNLESFDTVCRFEISRSSCMRSFDRGETAEGILTLLQKASGVELSQNLVFSVTEWFETYNSASLYHGFVLHVSKEKMVHIENNSVLAPHIKKTIAPGIYLFDFETREEVMSAIEKSSLDFIGEPKKNFKDSISLPFVEAIHKDKLVLDYSSNVDFATSDWESHADKMREELEKLDITKEQKEGLLERINRKLILSTKQLIGGTVRHEKMEANGIDFIGKIQVIEQALLANNMIEVCSATMSYIGRPVKIEKRDGDAVLVMNQEDKKNIKLLIGQARKVKRFRQPLF